MLFLFGFLIFFAHGVDKGLREVIRFFHESASFGGIVRREAVVVQCAKYGNGLSAYGLAALFWRW